MTRSLGTALGVALVTLALQLYPAGNQLLDGPRTALLIRTVVAALVLLPPDSSPRNRSALQAEDQRDGVVGVRNGSPSTSRGPFAR